MVNEEFLWVLWQNVLFDAKELQTVTGESVIIKKTGTLNGHAGPDFSLAHLRIGTMDWSGDVEIHTRSSDWYKHRHQNDAAYESVILHVVYEYDKDIIRKDGTVLPVLELKHRISAAHIENYKNLMRAKSIIPCASQFPQVRNITVEQMKQRVLVERLQRKTDDLYAQLLKQADWKTVAGKLLFKAFGTGLNDYLFERIAAAIDFNRLARLSHSKKSVEALLFGLSGMLELPFKDEYAGALKKEFEYLAHTYDVKPVVAYSEWKFLRTRPVNFATIRIAQLAALFSDPDWFNQFSQIATQKQALLLFDKGISSYWHTHYRFDVPSVHSLKKPGPDFISLCMINALIPFYVLEARYQKDADKWDTIFTLLESIHAENNVLTRNWKKVGMIIKNAYDTQSSIELYKMYCTHKKCLSCTIGHSVLRNEFIPGHCS
ncbi:MAG: DUF2851 family protein [Cytophagales bacterium]|nr:DUF2851 family protein [Cytophaga sp.]